MKIPRAQYQRILGSMPILCVDGVLRNSIGQVLLVKRNNEPLKDRWWVPGGRVLKGENVRDAFRRKMREELGVAVEKTRCLGFFETTALRHSEIEGGRVHSLSIVFAARIEGDAVALDSQSSDWGFFPRLPTLFKIQPYETDRP